MVDHGRVADGQIDLCPGTEGCRRGFGHAVDGGAERLGGGFVVGPQGTVEHNLVGDDIARMAPGDLAEGEDGGLGGVAAAADHRLEGGNDMGCGHDGVDRALGQGGVSTPSDDADVQFIGGGHVRPTPEAHGAGVQLRIDVLANDAVDGLGSRGTGSGFRGIGGQRAFRHHERGAAGQGLLSRLEDELDGALPVLTGGVQDLGRTEQAGRVGVVATGVHPAGDSTGVGPFHLLDGQGVHVGTEGEVPGAGFGPMQVGHDAGGPAVGAPACAVLDAHCG